MERPLLAACLVCAACLSVGLAVRPPAQPSRQGMSDDWRAERGSTTSGPLASFNQFLTTTLHASRDERAALDRGTPVVRLLPTDVSYELAVAGAVRIGAGVPSLVALMRDVRRWKGGPAILQLGVFSAPAVPGDVAALSLDPPDLDVLRRCANGKCDGKLAALAPDQFRSLDWTAPNARASADAMVRAALVRHVEGYRRRGDAALMVYPDSRRTKLASEFAGLLSASLYLQAHTPQLVKYFEQFPAGRPTRAESLFYWARETFGFKPVLSAYHVVIDTSGEPAQAVIASKQFYASRYFDISLDVTAAVSDPAAPGGGCYVAYLARSRADSLRGIFGGIKRRAAGVEAKEAVRKLLVRFQQLLAHP